MSTGDGAGIAVSGGGVWAPATLGIAATSRVATINRYIESLRMPGLIPGAEPPTGCRTMRSAVDHPLDQPVEQLHLRTDELRPRLVEREPLGPVDLGELVAATRARWPLHVEAVTAHGAGVEVAGRSPRGHLLAALLHDGAQLDEPVGGQARAGLLLELAQGRHARVLVGLVLALGDRPRAEVLLGPE